MIDNLEFHTASLRHLLVECPDLSATMHLHQALEATVLEGVEELIPAARTVLIRFNPARTSAPVLAEKIRGLEHTQTGATESREVTIDVHYDGEDIAEVAQLLSLSTAEVIARHQRATWQVAFSGFAPGFGYLAGDDPIFHVPRRSSPRTRVPVGAVGLAGEFTGIYPRASPGGWQLIGRTDATLWDLDREPPALFVPGTFVNFREAQPESVTVSNQADDPTVGKHADDDNAATQEASAEASASSTLGTSTSAHSCTVIRPGLQLLVQDLGRPGFAAMGVSSAGAADRSAQRAGNRLVGNAETAAGLESFGGGTKLAITGVGVAAVTGAQATITVTSAAGVNYRHHLGEAFSLEDGDTLELGTTERGARLYVAFRGGIETETALGSASSDTLAGLGPAHLEAKTTLALGGPELAPHLVSPALSTSGRTSVQPRQLPAPGETIELPVTLGPREGWFTAAGVTTLLDQVWTVTHESDRVGLRLNAEVPLERSRTGELPSEGAVTGALQVPPNGQPVLFGPDHPLTGGYPIIASVNDTDLAAQLTPGVRIRFTTDDDRQSHNDHDHSTHSPENGS